MSLSVQHSVVESFSFRGKNVRFMHVPDLGECLVGIDVSSPIGYVNDNNGRRAIKRHLPQKYTMRFEDVKDIAERHVPQTCHKTMQSCSKNLAFIDFSCVVNA